MHIYAKRHLWTIIPIFTARQTERKPAGLPGPQVFACSPPPPKTEGQGSRDTDLRGGGGGALKKCIGPGGGSRKRGSTVETVLMAVDPEGAGRKIQSTVPPAPHPTPKHIYSKRTRSTRDQFCVVDSAQYRTIMRKWMCFSESPVGLLLNSVGVVACPVDFLKLKAKQILKFDETSTLISTNSRDVVFTNPTHTHRPHKTTRPSTKMHPPPPS